MVRTDRGRAETLTAVLGWDVPLQAGLAGTLTFAGPLGAIGAEGDITLTHGVAFGQSFDQLTGQFGYGDGEFSVVNAKARFGAASSPCRAADPLTARGNCGRRG